MSSSLSGAPSLIRSNKNRHEESVHSGRKPKGLMSGSTFPDPFASSKGSSASGKFENNESNIVKIGREGTLSFEKGASSLDALFDDAPSLKYEQDLDNLSEEALNTKSHQRKAAHKNEFRKKI